MMINKRKLYLFNIRSYLEEISFLCGKLVKKEDLLSIEESNAINKQSMIILKYPERTFKLDFSDKEGDRFHQFICNLYSKNKNGVYIWTDKTNYCGLFLAKSIKDINFCFPYTINDNGMIVFSTSDLKDRLSIDFYQENSGDQVIEVTVQGASWVDVVY